MIDFHCHILPGIDDGSQNMEHSLELAWQSVEDGITHIVTTPHGNHGILLEQLGKRDKALAELRVRLEQEKIPLQLISGMEYSADGEFWKVVQEAPECRCGVDKGDERPLLLEIPLNMDISLAEDVYFKAQLKGVKIVLAHPERYEGFERNADMLQSLLDRGAFLQFNASSLHRGFLFFDSLPKTILKLIEHAPNQILLGSDAHHPEHRPAGFGTAREYVTKRLGEEVWKLMTDITPRKLLGLA